MLIILSVTYHPRKFFSVTCKHFLNKNLEIFISANVAIVSVSTGCIIGFGHLQFIFKIAGL
jgi:hypothetical protein